MQPKKVTLRKGGVNVVKAIGNKYRQTFNLKFRDDAAQYFALLDFLQQQSIRFAIKDNEHIRVVECNEKFAPVIEHFMSNEDVVQFAREFANCETRVRYAAL